MQAFETLMHLMAKASRVDSIGQASKFSANVLICRILELKVNVHYSKRNSYTIET